MKPIVWVADIGSVRKHNFAWCRDDSTVPITGIDITLFAHGIANDLSHNHSVAIGFECPLFIPITESPQDLTDGRPGEGNRPWSAGAGSSSLTTGLAECVWIFEKLHTLAQAPLNPTFDWHTFTKGTANLFIWEAMITSSTKGKSHPDDAQIAAHTFWQHYPDIDQANTLTAVHPYSLVGAALLRARLSTNLQLLFEPCIVIAP